MPRKKPVTNAVFSASECDLRVPSSSASARPTARAELDLAGLISMAAATRSSWSVSAMRGEQRARGAPTRSAELPHSANAATRERRSMGVAIGKFADFLSLTVISNIITSKNLKHRPPFIFARNPPMPSAEPSPKKARSDDVSLQGFLERVNGSYESVHTAFEHQFWGTKMALSTLSPDGQLCVCPRACARACLPPRLSTL